MREDIAGPRGASSRPMWETLEGMVREKAQEFIQQIMEEEVTELLGREKSERRSTVDSAEGYRNGYGKARRLAMSSGTITLRRPRVRGVEERFESRVLPLFARRTKELGALLPELYLHGLAEGDFELAMRGLLGEGAPLSKSSIRRLRAGWTAEFEEWSQRDARRDEGGVGPEIGLPRVGRVLVGGVAGSEGTRHRGAPASDGGRQRGDLGRSTAGMA